MTHKERTAEELQEMLTTIQECWIDGKNRAVDSSEKVEADGEVWGVVNDHGNVEFCYKGRNGRIYWLGGLV